MANVLSSAIQVAPFFRELYGLVGSFHHEPAALIRSQGTRNIEGPLSSLRVTDLAVGRDTILVGGLNFSVNSGELLLLSGESGCGKTTLLMTLVGLVKPLDGKIRWNGVRQDELDPIAFRRKASYVGPDPYLFSGTIRENLMFGVDDRTITEDMVERALWCSCAEFVHQKAGGLSATIGEDGIGLSAGQQQRLSIARAVLRRPELLLLDEATANIDVDTESAIIGRLRTILPEAIVVAVSHRATMQSFATHHVKLKA